MKHMQSLQSFTGNPARRTGAKTALGLVAGVALGLGVTSGAQEARADETFILAHSMQTDHIFHPISEKFIETLKGSAGDTLTVEYHPGGDLGDWTTLFEQSMQGAVPMTMAWGASDFDRRLDLGWLAYVVDNWEDAKKVYGPGGPMIEVFDTILKDLNLKLLGIIPTDFGSIAMRKGVTAVPVNYPDDAKGIKLRVPPVPITIKRFEALGFSPVPIPFAETYTALQLGTVDARATAPPVEIWQMRDVLESYILTRDYFEVAYWVVNADWWGDLTEEQQAQIQAAADEAIAWSWEAAEKEGQEFIEKAKGAGVNIVELTPEQLANAKKILYEVEWPIMEEIVGPEIMTKMKAIRDTK